MPAYQRLCPDDALSHCIETRLKLKPQLLARDSLAQIHFQLTSLHDALAHGRVVNACHISALGLGFIKRNIRTPQHRIMSQCMIRRGDDTNAGPDVNHVIPDLDRLIDLLDQTLAQSCRVLRRLALRGDHNEFISPESCDHIAILYAALDRFRNFTEHLIPNCVPVGIIDRLESIKIEGQHE